MHVAPSDVGVLVPGLLHDEGEVGAATGGRGCKPTAQRVAGVFARVKADPADSSLDDFGYGLAGEPVQQLVVEDRPEDRTGCNRIKLVWSGLGDRTLAQPRLECGDRAGDRALARPRDPDLAAGALLIGL